MVITNLQRRSFPLDSARASKRARDVPFQEETISLGVLLWPNLAKFSKNMEKTKKTSNAKKEKTLRDKEENEIAEGKIFIRDLRKGNKFFIDNAFIDFYGPLFGTKLLAVYNILCRYANKNQRSYPSIKKIASMIKVSEKTIKNALSVLSKLNVVKKKRLGNGLSNSYWLLDDSKWIKKNIENYIDFTIWNNNRFTLSDRSVQPLPEVPTTLSRRVPATPSGRVPATPSNNPKGLYSKNTKEKQDLSLNRIVPSAPLGHGFTKKQEQVSERLSDEKNLEDSFDEAECLVAEVSLDQEISPSNLLESPTRHLKIIGLFAQLKNITFLNKQEMHAFIARHCKTAARLAQYDENRIFEIMLFLTKMCRSNIYKWEWNLETVEKYTDKDVKALEQKEIFNSSQIISS